MIDKLKDIPTDVEFYDLNHFTIKSEYIVAHNKELKSYTTNDSESFGIRVVVDGCWGFASFVEESELSSSFRRAYLLAKNNSRRNKHKFVLRGISDNKARIETKYSGLMANIDDKLSLVRDFNSSFSLSSIKSITTNLSFQSIERRYMNSYGAEIYQRDLYSRIYSLAVAGPELINTTFLYGKKVDFADFDLDVGKSVSSMQNDLKDLFRAKYITPSNYNIVMDPKMGGTFFHEAIGHALEADGLKDKTTCVSLGEKVGVDSLTLLDDPTIDKRWGSYRYDDEGIKSKPTELIKNGVIINFINDLYSYSEVDGLKKSANGRIDSPLYYPIPRMSNTVVKEGEFSKEELFEEIKNGIYVKGFVGGSVDTMSGVFGFKSTIAYEIVDGKLGKPLKPVSLSGNLKELLKNIVAIGKYEDVNSIGFCGKGGQHVPVSDLVPNIGVRGVNVGI